MPIQLRRLQPGDVAALASFFAKNENDDVRKNFNPFPLDREQAVHLCAIAPIGQDVYVVAVEGSMIVGLCMLRGWDEGYVVPSFGILVDGRRRGSGLGRRLTQAALQSAQNAGAPSVRLTVNAGNERAIALYRSLGFRETQRVESEQNTVLTMHVSLRGPEENQS